MQNFSINEKHENQQNEKLVSKYSFNFERTHIFVKIR